MTLPLEGIRVLSLAENLPGPYATLVLADLGADVVQVERPPAGDPGRTLPGLFEALSRGERSILLDLKLDAGRDAFLRLADRSDVVIEGYRPGTVDRLGVGYETVRSRNPRVVYVSITGYGQTGPYRDRPGHDVAYQAVAGLLHERLGQPEPGEPPFVTTADLASATFAVAAALLGLFVRERTSTGLYVDVSMLDALVSWMSPFLVPAIDRLGTPGIPHPPGYGLYRTADGQAIALGVLAEGHLWRALCEAVGLDDLVDISFEERMASRHEIEPRLRAAVAGRSRADWERILGERGVAFGPVNSLAEVAADPQVRARGLILSGAGAPTGIRQPLTFQGLPPARAGSPPRPGEHGDDVLAEAGFSSAEIQRLRAAGAFGPIPASA